MSDNHIAEHDADDAATIIVTVDGYPFAQHYHEGDRLLLARVPFDQLRGIAEGEEVLVEDTNGWEVFGSFVGLDDTYFQLRKLGRDHWLELIEVGGVSNVHRVRPLADHETGGAA